jgi:hypothetical protein
MCGFLMYDKFSVFILFLGEVERSWLVLDAAFLSV